MGLTQICGGDGTAMAVEAEVGKRREDRRRHARRWRTGLTWICGGDGTAMVEKEICGGPVESLTDLWQICGGGGMAKVEQQNGAVMAALNGDGKGVVEKKWRKKKNKRNGDGVLFSS
jgi:hypothetical protein